MILLPTPYTLSAEVAHAWSSAGELLDPAVWECVIDEAAELGVVQIHLTGGDPLRYPGLDRLVARARARQLYTTLVTTGFALDQDRLAMLCAAGLDYLQLDLGGARLACCERGTRRCIHVAPDGIVRPFGESVCDHPLAEIWERACEVQAQNTSSLASASRISRS